MTTDNEDNVEPRTHLVPPSPRLLTSAIQGDSPLHRAGLLQPLSYKAPTFQGYPFPYDHSTNHDQNTMANLHLGSPMIRIPVHPHSPDTIRANTVQLSDMHSTPRRSITSSLISPFTSTATNPQAAPGPVGPLPPNNDGPTLANVSKAHDDSPNLPSSLSIRPTFGVTAKTSDSQPQNQSSPGPTQTNPPSSFFGRQPHHTLSPSESRALAPSHSLSTPRSFTSFPAWKNNFQIGQEASQKAIQGPQLTALGQTAPTRDTPHESRNNASSSGHPTLPRPSGLSLLRKAYEEDVPKTLKSPSFSSISRPDRLASPSPSFSSSAVSSSDAETITPQNKNAMGAQHVHFNEQTPLLGGPNTSLPVYHHHVHKKFSKPLAGTWQFRTAILDFSKSSLHAVPAVLLGCLLNILDGVSYGMILFPTSAPFTDLGPMGVSMFFVSCIVAQLVYTFGGSAFKGANGSMMIEVVPFFHILAASIAKSIGEDQPEAVIATTLAAYAMSSILTGLSFFLLGYLRLGVIIGFFPRHILVGCIGGVGAFLVQTGLTVSLRIPDDEFAFNFEMLRVVFLDKQNLVLWVLPLALAVLLRLMTERWKHQLLFPAYFIMIPVIFYFVVFVAGLDLETLRKERWVFDLGLGEQENWYKFYTYWDFNLIRWESLWATLPTQFALLFFNILHPPLNVPALSVSLNEDVDTDRELVAHGYSNLLAGLFGTVPNYLVYVNTLLFYRVGGTTRIAGFLLAVATAALLFIGTGPIAFIPVMVVGALIFVLGIDLMKEALWDTRHRVSRMEYITIASIMVCMTVWDFVIGVVFGIIVSCFFFVVENSQRTSIRALHTGETVMSTVRRPSLQRAYLREVSKQTTIIRLQGFLFFGTITHVEETIRTIINGPSWQTNPVQFLVVDLTLVAGVDMSSAEAFVRIQRLLATKYVTLVLCGVSEESSVGKSLQNVGLLDMEGVELFLTFNDAMEWTENAYLRAWFRSQKPESPTSTPFALPGRQDADIDYRQTFVGSIADSVRRSHLREAGNKTIGSEVRHNYGDSDHPDEPHNTLSRAFSSYGPVGVEEFEPLTAYLTCMSVPEGVTLWKQGDEPDGLYIIESGVLRAKYNFSDGAQCIEESMVPGTVAGELSALSGLPRNATVVVERAAVLWKLSIDALKLLEVEQPELARVFLRMVLKAAKIDYDILLSALASRQ